MRRGWKERVGERYAGAGGDGRRNRSLEMGSDASSYLISKVKMTQWSFDGLKIY